MRFKEKVGGAKTPRGTVVGKVNATHPRPTSVPSRNFQRARACSSLLVSSCVCQLLLGMSDKGCGSVIGSGCWRFASLLRREIG